MGLTIGEDPIIIVLHRQHELARSKSGRRQQLLSIRPPLVVLAGGYRLPALLVGALPESVVGAKQMNILVAFRNLLSIC